MTAEDPILEGEKVILRPLTAADVPLLVRWLFNPEVLHWLQLSEDPPELHTPEAMQERYEQTAADPNTKVWRIDTRQGQPIGQIELVEIHGLQKRAEMHLAIGEKEYWSGGYGGEAIRLVLRHAFEGLALRRVFIVPDADNVRAIRAFEKAGFVHEGTLRAHRLRYGEPVDMVVMGVLREEMAGETGG